MADDKSKQAIIIKKVVKGGHASHGGAWKIAYADFVTAMMAFFLLLWLLNSVTQEQLEGISNYFAPVSVAGSVSGSGDILSGATITSEEGVAKSSTSKDSVVVNLPPPKAGTGGAESAGEQKSEPTEEELEEEKQKKAEEDQFEEAQKELELKFHEMPEFKDLEESLLIDNTPEGLRIQLLDKDGLPMFSSGGAEMLPHARRLIQLVAKVIGKMPQQISISGHTDSQRFISKTGYSNWELSADRANAARRELVSSKIPYEKVSKVVGKAATDPFLLDDPGNARNRRLSIIMLRGTGRKQDGEAAKKAKIEAKAKAKKKKEESGLPGLHNIKKRQAGEGLKSPIKKKKEEPKTRTPIKQTAKPKGLELEIKPEEKAPSLPGLENIRRRQLKKGAGSIPLIPAAPGAGAAQQSLPGLEGIGKRQLQDGAGSIPLIPAAPGGGGAKQSLPGLDAIRKNQLEKSQ
ncbi:MAG: flagellar motor protein MotB [Rhodospirillales bacterium]|nr:flagellar motor protein MotB [Rhodospirillales bacterium]